MARESDDPHAFVIRDERRLRHDGERFDRVAYAMRALRWLRPRGLSVAVVQGRAALRVEQGRQWDAPAGSRWATVVIPPTASRAEIALAMAELAGVEANPVVLQALLEDGFERDVC